MAYDQGYFNEVMNFIRSERADAGAETLSSTVVDDGEEETDEPDFDDRFETPMSLETIFEEFGQDGDDALRTDGSAALRSLIPGSPTSADTFVRFFNRLGIRNFSPSELLVLGGHNASGKCKGLNYLPAKSLWPRIAPTIVALDSIRDTLGYPIFITNAYRSPEYNACLRTISKGVAKSSQHIQFRAIDFKGASGSPVNWHSEVEKFRDRNGEFGIWTKQYASFVHIDTRGAH